MRYDDDDDDDDDNDELLDLCPVAALIYSVLSPPGADENTLGTTELREREWSEAPALMLWIAFMAGALRPWEQMTAPAGRGLVGLIGRGASRSKIRFLRGAERTASYWDICGLPTTNDRGRE
ncbi:hypothetical protein CLCR_07750 [Cladophialophora carrionii]|uniref:Uncharacterized protein n=1 Tax=Cladophialophora carrionii TaxID=86049 RepID=A0A1C1CP47_9EURO|nr:hypothetical protein CLCR_07750 [Cladophialophora carrionii]